MKKVTASGACVLLLVFWVSGFADATLISTLARGEQTLTHTPEDYKTGTSGTINSNWQGIFMGVASASASSNGALAVSIDGRSHDWFDYFSAATFSSQYTNNSAIDRDYIFGFSAPGGQIGFNVAFEHYFPEEWSSSFSINILLNGSYIWSSSTELRANLSNEQSDVIISQSGTDLGGTLEQGGGVYPNPWAEYTFGPFSDILALGRLSPGDSIILEYLISVRVKGCEYGVGYANLGDPLHIALTPGFYGFVSSEPVPEPTTILLIGSGLFGLAGFARKNFKKSHHVEIRKQSCYIYYCVIFVSPFF